MHALFLSMALAAISPATEDAQIANAEAELMGKDDVKPDPLTLAGSRARVEKDTLVLTLDDGKTVRLRNRCTVAEEEPCANYKLAAVLPSRGIFVVEKLEDENHEILLIEMANGKQHSVDGPPHFSPDGKRFLTCRVDEMNGGGAAVWRVAPGRYVQEWKDDRNSVCGRWSGNDSVTVGVYAAEPSGKPRPMTLVHKGDTWQLR
ncbi:MAG TPA: hypothetical protein VMF58_10075 [Rhizomicrobium sp.]|nr:hypothetical protein [Rhizomicrobium sp.]